MDLHNTVIIFSHGFGVRKDSRGFFTDMAAYLESFGVITVLFDYNDYDEETKELFALPFSEQAKKLQRVIEETHAKYPTQKIVIVGQSQGGTIAALCDMKDIAGVIMISPFFHTDMKEILDRYTKLTGNTLDLANESRRKRTDGSVTVIPASYWKERLATDVVGLYNSIALRTKLYIVYAMQDEVMHFTGHHLIKNAYMINVDGNHDISKEYRAPVMKIVHGMIQNILHE